MELKVKEVIRETKDASTIVLEHPQGEKINYKAGQFFTVLVNIDGQEERRSYSMSSSPFQDPSPAVTVKRVEGGKVSNYLNEHLKAGDLLKVLPPAGTFTTDIAENKKRHLIMFAGGSGITPIMALTKSILYQESKSTVSLIYANRDWESVIFKLQLEELSQKFPKTFNLVHVLEQAPNTDWKEPTGRLNTALLKELLKRFPKFLFNPTEYYMCGPAPMMEVVNKAFGELKLPKDKLRKESFTSSLPPKSEQKTTEPAQSESGTWEVTVKYAGETHQFSVKPDQTILEAALSKDIDLPYSCQSGMCTACMGKCVSGQVELETEDALTPKELQQGFVLTCVGHPKSADVIIEID